MRPRKSWVRAWVVIVLSVLGWTLLERTLPADGQRSGSPPPAQSSPVFTTAHPTVVDAVKEFFNQRPKAVQPIAFPHKTHLANSMPCTDCHTGVDKGPEARIPSVNLCMTCHQAIATDRPEIKKVAAYLARGEDIPWQRVYGFAPSAHVRFNHAPHIRTGVACAKCHGDMTQQTVAIRAVNLTMGYCLQCHREKKASTDCVTCHY